MKNFSDFKNDTQEAQNGNANSGNIVEQFSALAAAYEGKSADEIMKAILKEAEKGRKNGTLSDGDIDEFAKMISPVLSDGQRKTLDKVVARLKSK